MVSEEDWAIMRSDAEGGKQGKVNLCELVSIDLTVMCVAFPCSFLRNLIGNFFGMDVWNNDFG